MGCCNLFLVSSGGPLLCPESVHYFTVHPCRLAVVVITDYTQPFRLVVQRSVHPTGTKSVLLTEWVMSEDFTVIQPEDIDGPTKRKEPLVGGATVCSDCACRWPVTAQMRISLTLK